MGLSNGGKEGEKKKGKKKSNRKKMQEEGKEEEWVRECSLAVGGNEWKVSTRLMLLKRLS